MKIEDAIDIVEAALLEYHPIHQRELSLLEQKFDKGEMDFSPIIEISALDGYFTAIISAPNLIPPSEWLPHIWGEPQCSPEWKNIDELNSFIQAVMTLYNRVAKNLMKSELIPLILEIGDDLRPVSVLWVHGYLHGMQLWSDWQDDEVINTLSEDFARLMLHAETAPDDCYDSIEEGENEMEQIFEAVLSIHEYFFERRTADRLASTPKSKRGVTKSPKPPKRKRRLH